MCTDEKVIAKNWSSTMINRIELINGGWPVPQFRIPMDMLKEITVNCPRLALVGGMKEAGSAILLKRIIPGGIRMPHLHLGNEIVLLDKPALQKYLEVAAQEVAKIEDITDVGEYIRF